MRGSACPAWDSELVEEFRPPSGRGTSRVQTTTAGTYPVVTADGVGVVSHVGAALLSEVADRVGLTAAFGEATGRLRVRRSGHDPGRVLVGCGGGDRRRRGDDHRCAGVVGSASGAWAGGLDRDDLAGAGRGGRGSSGRSAYGAGAGAGLGRARGVDRDRVAGVVGVPAGSWTTR